MLGESRSLEAQITAEPIHRRTATEAVVQQLQRLIAQNQMKVGDQLGSERDLAAALGVSRSTLREALRVMESLDILDVRQGKGTFVKQPQSRPFTNLAELGGPERRRLLIQVTEARRVIDVEAARLAAANRHLDLIADIRSYFEATLVEPLRTQREFTMDLAFEQRIALATGNPYLVEIQRTAHKLYAEAWEQGGFIPRLAAIRNEQHAQILAAIEDGDPDAAAQLMTLHFELGIMPDTP